MKTYKTRHQFYLPDELSDKLKALAELVGVFVQHQLSRTAHRPDIGPEAANRGLQRFNKLLDFVEHRLAKGSRLPRLTTSTTRDGDEL